MATISEALAMAVQHHQAGRLPAAEEIYRQILAADPRHAQTWHLLGVVHEQRGEHAQAAAAMGRAIALAPDVAPFHWHLGNVQLAASQMNEAAACYRRALQLNPSYAEAHNNLGIVLQRQRDWEGALSSYRQALALGSQFPQTHNNLGLVLEHLGQRDEAMACFRRALALNPNYAEAYCNLGNALQALKQPAAAEGCYRRALELRSDFFQAFNNLAVVLQDQGEHDEALRCFQQALELNPNYAEAHYNLGNLLEELLRHDEAIASFHRAVALQPDHDQALCNLGHVLVEQGRRDEAVDCYRRVLELRPNCPAAAALLVHELQHLCDWSEVAALSRRVIEGVSLDEQGVEGTLVPPFALLTLSTPTTAEQQLQCARQWSRWQSLSALSPSEPRRKGTAAKKRLTIGYLSADFHAHATAMLIAELFEMHDRQRFEIVGYSYGPADDCPMRRRLVGALDRFVDIKNLTARQAAQQIAADGVDILLDLKGYTGGARTQILAYRPAPVQVNYLGYPGTMGADFIDYILVDDFIVPPDQQPFFSERLVYLPGCYQVNDSQRAIAAQTPSRGACGLPEQGFVFCSFNNSYKITPAMFDVWMRLLQAVDGSVLWLLEGNRFAPDNLRRAAAARGIAPERLVFAPRLEADEHLARYRRADLFLDTLPVNAHTTASDALWAGCPVLTIAGETFVARVAGSLLRALDLTELIAANLDDYAACALRLAGDPTSLAALRARLQTNRQKSPLFDAGQFVPHLEQAFDTIWQIHLSGQPPRSFAVGRS